MDGLLLFIGVCILNSLRQLVEYYFSQGLTKPLLTIPESIVPEAKTMTDEEAAAFLRLALTSEEARAYLKKRTEGGKSE